MKIGPGGVSSCICDLRDTRTVSYRIVSCQTSPVFFCFRGGLPGAPACRSISNALDGQYRMCAGIWQERWVHVSYDTCFFSERLPGAPECRSVSNAVCIYLTGKVAAHTRFLFRRDRHSGAPRADLTGTMCTYTVEAGTRVCGAQKSGVAL